MLVAKGRSTGELSTWAITVDTSDALELNVAKSDIVSKVSDGMLEVE